MDTTKRSNGGKRCEDRCGVPSRDAPHTEESRSGDLGSSRRTKGGRAGSRSRHKGVPRAAAGNPSEQRQAEKAVALNRRRRVDAKQALKTGLEPNPGMGGTRRATPVNQDVPPKLRISRSTKATKADVKQVESLVAQEIKLEVERLAGTQDAVEEKDDEREAERIRGEDERTNAQWADEARSFSEDLGTLRGTAFHPILPDEGLKAFAQVEPREMNLTDYGIPHKVCVVDDVVVIPAVRREGGKTVPLVAQMPEEAAMCSKHPAYTIVVKWELKTYGFLGKRTGYDTGECTIALDQFFSFRSSRISQYTLSACLDKAMLFRRRNPCFVRNSRRLEQDDVLNDNIFCALVLSSSRRLTQGCGLATDLMGKALSNALYQALLKDGPSAGGVYVVGYPTNFADIFPDEFREACHRNAVLGPKRAAEEFAKKVMDANASLWRRAGFSRDQVVDQLKKSLGYCRRAPISVEGIVPAFPDAFHPKNLMMGLVKRILRRRGEQDAESEQYEEAACQTLVDAARDDPGDQWVPSDGVDDYIAKKGSKWSPDDREAFRRGAMEVDEVANMGSEERLGAFIAEIHELITQMKAFVKCEAYESGEVKATRNIVCPSFRLRGILWALCHEGNERFFAAQADHAVKHKTPEENMAITTEMFGHEGGGDQVQLATDGSAFESLVTAKRRWKEFTTLCAFSPLKIRRTLEEVTKIFQERWSLAQAMWTCDLDSIRRSGEFNTSCGNYVVNHNITFGAIARAAKVPIEKAADWIREYKARHPYRFEGDDGLVSVPARLLDAIGGCFKKAGVKMSMASAKSVEETEFCGAKVVEVEGTPVIYKDPFDLLARVTHWIGCNPDSSKNDQDMMTSRAISYYLVFGHLPVIGPFCYEVLRKRRDEVKRLLAAARSTAGKVDVATRSLRERLWHARQEYGKDDAIMLSEDELYVDKSRFWSHPELLGRVGESCGACAETIHAWGLSLRQGVQDGVGHITVPGLAEVYAKAKGVRAMTEHFVHDARETVAAASAAAATSTAAKWAAVKTGTLAKVSAFTQGVAAAGAWAGWWCGVFSFWAVGLGLVATFAGFALFYVWTTIILRWPKELVRWTISAAGHALTLFVIVGWIGIFRKMSGLTAVLSGTPESSPPAPEQGESGRSLADQMSDAGFTMKYRARQGISSLLAKAIRPPDIPAHMLTRK